MPELSARFETTALEHDIVRDERVEWAGDLMMMIRNRVPLFAGRVAVFEALGRQFSISIGVSTNDAGTRLTTYFLFGPDWMVIYGVEQAQGEFTKTFLVRNRPAMERDAVLLMMTDDAEL